jgi:hypothetical protein
MSRVILSVFICLSCVAACLGAPPPSILKKQFPFPPSVEWKSGQTEISLTEVAWGPADSPEMISEEQLNRFLRAKPAFFPDRTYALALKFRAHTLGLTTSELWGSSGLVLVKDINGNLEAPMELTALGFVPRTGAPGAIDFHFDHANTTEFLDYFPVSFQQKEFLFQVFGPSGLPGYRRNLRVSFKVVIKDDDLLVVNALPGAQNACPDFTRNFSGTIGSNVEVRLELTVQGTTLSGTEQYSRVGKTLWLTGRLDSLGNFVLNENYPKDHVTGIFKGQFSQGCQSMTGYFSKPDGSRLLPFDLEREEK